MIPSASPLSPALAALGLSLIHFLWQGLVIAAVLRLALAVLGRTESRARYLSACVAMAAMLAALVGTFVWIYSDLTALSVLPALSEELPFAALGSAPAPGPRWLYAVVIAWEIGAVGMSLRLAFGLLHIRAMVQGSALLPDEWQATVTRLAARLGVRTKVLVAESRTATVPSVVGWLRPVILLPAAVVLGLPRSALEAVLAHELAHVRRHDYLVNVLQSLVAALLFYHPLVHWVSRTLRVEREHCCDDLVVELTGDPVSYARALLAVESFRSAPLEPGLAATGGSLMDRIQRIVRGPAPPHARAARWLAPSLLAASLAGAIAVTAVACGGAASKTDSAPEIAAPGAQAAEATEAKAAAIGIAWLPERVRRWTPYFLEAAQQHGVDPEMLAIVTLVESLGDPDARSSIGALGLMQIMPATAARIAKEGGFESPNTDRLRDPAYNIDLGAFYLKRQIETFGANVDPGRSVELAAAAYNGGEKQLRAYLDQGAPLSDETSHYKSLVRALWEQRHDTRSTAFEAFESRLHHAAP